MLLNTARYSRIRVSKLPQTSPPNSFAELVTATRIDRSDWLADNVPARRETGRRLDGNSETTQSRDVVCSNADFDFPFIKLLPQMPRHRGVHNHSCNPFHKSNNRHSRHCRRPPLTAVHRPRRVLPQNLLPTGLLPTSSMPDPF